MGLRKVNAAMTVRATLGFVIIAVAYVRIAGAEEGGLIPEASDSLSGDFVPSRGFDAPSWQVTVEGMLIQRDDMDSVPLIVDLGGAITLLNADELSLRHRNGIRLSASRQVVRSLDLELEYSRAGLADDSVLDSAAGAEMFAYGAAFGTAPLSLVYGSDLNNYEFNWRYGWCRGPLKMLVGARHMALDESMTVTDAASPPQLFLGNLRNHMDGGQVGVEGVICQNRFARIEGGIKLGFYNNSANFDAAFPQAGPGATFEAASDEHAYSTELWLGVNSRLTERLSLKLGYRLMWLRGIALLPEQLDDMAVPIVGELQVKGDPVYRGMTVGLQLDW